MERLLLSQVLKYGEVVFLGVGIYVKDVMVKDVVTVTPRETLHTAVRKIVAEDVGSLVVVDGGKPVGILTRGDMLKALVSGADFKKERVKSHMTAPLITINPNADIEDVARLMRDKKIKRVPVINDVGKLVGIISETDIISISPAIYQIIRDKVIMER